MIDFWEALGRMVAYPDLADKFIAKYPGGHSIPRASVNGQKGLKIPEGKYEDIQKFFAPVLAEGTMSIMAAGEMYWAASFKNTSEDLKKLCSFVQKKKIPSYGPSSGFFISLGIIVVDKYLREDPATTSAFFDNGPRMAASEKSQILALAKDPEFNKLSTHFCQYSWDGHNCDVTAVFWPGRIQPLALSEESAEYQEAKA